MLNSFEIDRNKSAESKIAVALERIAEAYRVLLWNESKANMLSPIQIQILIFILFHPSNICKVSYLSREFNMTKATISDSVRVLLEKKLLTKTLEEHDTRSFSLSLTATGKKIAKRAASFADSIEKPIQNFSENQKEVLLVSLLEIIEKLQKVSIIDIQRMCFSCRFYRRSDAGHYCNLLQKPLANLELKVDCEEYQEQS